MCLNVQSVKVNDELAAVVRSCSYTFICLTLWRIKRRENGGGGYTQTYSLVRQFRARKVFKVRRMVTSWLFGVKGLLIDGSEIWWPSAARVLILINLNCQGCARIRPWNVEFEYQPRFCPSTEENRGKTWRSWPVAKPSRWTVTLRVALFTRGTNIFYTYICLFLLSFFLFLSFFLSFFGWITSGLIDVEEQRRRDSRSLWHFKSICFFVTIFSPRLFP